MAVAKKRSYTRRNVIPDPVNPPSKVDLTNPVAMRTRIAEINQIAADLHKERTMLEESIKAMGFHIIGTGPASPKDWKPGMAIKCNTNGYGSLTKDRIYLIEDVNTNGKFVKIRDDDDDTIEYGVELFEYVAG